MRPTLWVGAAVAVSGNGWRRHPGQPDELGQRQIQSADLRVDPNGRAWMAVAHLLACTLHTLVEVEQPTHLHAHHCSRSSPHNNWRQALQALQGVTALSHLGPTRPV